MTKHNRILILGNGASGKTTLALQLSALTPIETLLHLDAIYWKKGWAHHDKTAFLGAVSKVISQDQWIIEGTPLPGIDARIARADTIIFLETNTYLCLLRAIVRSIQYHLKLHKNTSGCPAAAFSWKTLRWIWQFNKTTRSNIKSKITTATAPHKYIITNKHDMDHLLSTFN